MGNNFNLSGYPDNLRGSVQNSGYPSPLREQNESFNSISPALEEWYRGSQDHLEQKSPEQGLFHLARSGQSKRKFVSLLKGSLQVVTIVILIIIAATLGGFIFLDRKLNLEDTQASLNRMSEALAQESQGTAASTSEVQSKSDTRFFNASENTNVDISSLPPEIDTDQDGLSNEVEEKLGTNPFQADSDNDGYPDGTEVRNGYPPLIPASREISSSQNTSSAPRRTANRSTASKSLGGRTEITPQVASASSCSSGEGISGGTGSCSISQSYGGSQTLSPETPDFSGLTSDDYQALQQFGLSQEDIDKAASGDVSIQEKIGFQEKIVSSPLMQENLQMSLNSIQAYPLPDIPDNELNLYISNREQDVKRYLSDVDDIFEKNFSGLVDLDRGAFRNQLISGDYTEVGSMNNAFENAYQELKALPVPQGAKEVHRGFLIMMRLYADLVNEETALSEGPDKVPTILSKVKSFQDLESMMSSALLDLDREYNLE